MSRPVGRRNSNFEAKRSQLAGEAGQALMKLGAGASLRELAAEMEVSVTNVSHYFGDRDGLFVAIAEHLHQAAEPHLRRAATPSGSDLTSILETYLRNLLVGWRQFGVDRVFVVGLGEGLGDPRRGPAYVNGILEPTLQAAEKLLETLVDQGFFPPENLRLAALTLVSPILLALLHQDALSGDRCRPLDVEALISPHVARWMQGYLPRSVAETP